MLTVRFPRLLGGRPTTAPPARAAKPGGRDLPFKLLALEVNRLAQEQRLRTLMVTSGLSGDGRTLVVASLARSLCDLGLRVTAVEAGPDSTALTTRLTTGCNASDTTAAADGTLSPYPGLTVVPGGALPSGYPDPEEMRLLLARLAANADLVLVDTVSCAAAPDAFVLAPVVDGVLYVVRRRQQDVVEQRSTIARLSRFGGRVLGAVYNEKELKR